VGKYLSFFFEPFPVQKKKKEKSAGGGEETRCGRPRQRRGKKGKKLRMRGEKGEARSLKKRKNNRLLPAKKKRGVRPCPKGGEGKKELLAGEKGNFVEG